MAEYIVTELHSNGKLVAQVIKEEIVRCRKCKHCRTIHHPYGNGHTLHCKMGYGMPRVDHNDFCSRGEMNDNG